MKETVKTANELNINPTFCALHGGEDYELIFTGSSVQVLNVLKLLGESAAIIGKIVEDSPGNVSVIDQTGTKSRYVSRNGWDHFS